MFTHPHVTATYLTVRWNSAYKGSVDMKTIYVIETDLPLSSDDDQFDENAFNELVTAAKNYLVENPKYDSIEIVPSRSR